MKVSDLTNNYIADYLRIDDPGDIELNEIDAMRIAAVEYVKGYTGLTIEEIDQHEDITVAVLILIADYYENRTLYLDYKYKEENSTVSKLLSMHCINFL